MPTPIADAGVKRWSPVHWTGRSRLLVTVSGVLFGATLLLYLGTFSPLGMGDGPAWLNHAVSGELARMFRLEHMLHTPLLTAYLRAVTWGGGLPLSAWDVFELTRLAQVPFAIAAAAGVVLQFHLALKATGQLATSVLASVLLAFTSGYWLNANLETKCYTLFFWMLTYVLGLSYSGKRSSRVALIAVSGATATLCQIDAGLLLPVALYFVVARHLDNWRRALGRSLLLVAIWFGILIAVVGLVGSQMPSFTEWLFQGSALRHLPGYFQARDFRYVILNPVKGLAVSLAIAQSDAFATGYMLIKRIFLDGDYIPADYGRLALYLVVMAGTAYYAVRGVIWLAVRRPRGERRLALGGLLVWFGGYHLATWWNLPIYSDYRVVTLPPLLVLLALGMTSHLRSCHWAVRLLPVVFAALLALNTWILGVQPQIIHGLSVRHAYRYLREEATSDDRFVISEWSVPWPPQVAHVLSPLTSAAAGTDSSADEVVAALADDIQSALAEGRRVFVYGLVPGDFTLRSLNALRPADDVFSAAQFQDLQDRLMAEYRWYPVLELVDARNQTGYQLGRKVDTLWLICPPARPE